jgi:hypothetical protein
MKIGKFFARLLGLPDLDALLLARLLAERVVDRREIADLRREVAGLRRELASLRQRAERTGWIIGEAAACGAIERRGQ